MAKPVCSAAPFPYQNEVHVGLRINNISRSSDDRTFTISGWLQVEWQGGSTHVKNRVKLDSAWRPDIRLLNSITDSGPLLNDDTEVFVSQDYKAFAMVHIRCQVCATKTSHGNDVIKIVLGSFVCGTKEVVFTPIAQDLDMSHYNVNDDVIPVATSMMAKDETVHMRMTGEVKTFSRIIATVTMRP